jgi:hypothetical protein
VCRKQEEFGTYHLQITIQVRLAKPPTRIAPSTMETQDARGSLPESAPKETD